MKLLPKLELPVVLLLFAGGSLFAQDVFQLVHPQ